MGRKALAAILLPLPFAALPVIVGIAAICAGKSAEMWREKTNRGVNAQRSST